MSEKPPALEIPTNREVLETLLTVPGDVGQAYSRFHNYSPRNIAFLAMQGCPPEPVATFRKWQELDRQVQKGQKAFSILRPIQVRLDKEGEEQGDDADLKMIRRFKVVRALFAYSQTAGEELPHVEPRDWSTERALGVLGIKMMPFELYQGNVGGYASGRSIAINPLAPYPLRTTLHEMSHVEHGHTTPENMKAYGIHRGQMEFEAEASAYVTLNALGELPNEVASVSRGYVQGWLQDERPTDQSLRNVLNVSTRVLNAGYEAAVETEHHG